MVNSTNDAPPLTRRRRFQDYAIAGFYLAMCIVSPTMTFCVVSGLPRQLWIEYFPLRWILLGAMVAYVWWFWPEILQAFARLRKRASR